MSQLFCPSCGSRARGVRKNNCLDTWHDDCGSTTGLTEPSETRFLRTRRLEDIVERLESMADFTENAFEDSRSFIQLRLRIEELIHMLRGEIGRLKELARAGLSEAPPTSDEVEVFRETVERDFGGDAFATLRHGADQLRAKEARAAMRVVSEAPPREKP